MIMNDKIKQFDFVNPSINPIEIANKLITELIDNKYISISAIQLGMQHRIFVLRAETPIVCFNPRIIDATTELVQLDEFCGSQPNLIIPIKRPRFIKVRFQNVYGETKTEKFLGMTAKYFQHELDHLDGIDYTLRANKFHLERAKRKQKSLSRQQKNNNM